MVFTGRTLCGLCAKADATPGFLTCQTCREKTTGWTRRHRSALSPEEQRSIHLKRAYGITLAQYEEMRAHQDYRCAICLRHEDEIPQPPPKGRPRLDGQPKALAPKLAVDHCHQTGVVRGLLCGRCNHGIGQFGDDPEVLGRAIDYLRRSPKRR